MNSASIVNNQNDEVSNDDEYNELLKEGIEDDSVNENPGGNKFIISSYGADYTVDGLVQRMRKKAFCIPKFQRNFVWNVRHASKFIESLLMGLPVPGIFLYKQDDGTHLVIDGQQRLRTLQAFYDGVFNGKEFKLQGVCEPWLGCTYKDLRSEDMLKLDDSTVHTTIFKQDNPKNVQDSIYFVFERINTGGIRLSPQEVRNCISSGRFIDLIQELNTLDQWRSVFANKNIRSKDEELIIRFFALYINDKVYSRPMNTFLNHFSDEMNKASEEQLKKLSETFKNTISAFDNALAKKAFRIKSTLNAAVFDAMMVGLARRLDRPLSPPSNDAIKNAHNNLIKNEEFVLACRNATSDEEKVSLRLKLACKEFEGI